MFMRSLGPLRSEVSDKRHDNRGPRAHIGTRISQSGSKAQCKVILEIMVCKILMVLWSFRALDFLVACLMHVAGHQQ